MWLRSSRSLLLTSFLIQVISSSANTEIINLIPSPNPRIPALDSISSNWPVLTPAGGQNERRWTMTHVPREGDTEGCIRKREWCEDDLWLVLDFDAEEWSAYRGFTLRISWPASHPFDFQLEGYTPQGYALKAGHNVNELPPTHPKTRNMYARIRPINTGVLAPWAQRAIALNRTHSQAMRDYGKVEFITILEPLRFGGVPETLLPTIAFLVPLVLIAGFVVFPQIHAYVAWIANEARVELEEKRL
ncbi:hypothetical protein BDM02DRAFT_3107109 [Thelephora ganbajun]|uniref:Uncharacterized protein n=1 Tax=Thelephora ganbajun TaxID=370292 RepID=A0ACB6ZWH7_THEGA|nr:hypothetical protein BDM02DRAFT_3107109 [Thelephora ganbajun]